MSGAFGAGHSPSVFPNAFGIHHSVWALAVNFATVLVVSRLTAPPSAATVERIHGEVERFVYGDR